MPGTKIPLLGGESVSAIFISILIAIVTSGRMVVELAKTKLFLCTGK